MIFSFGARANVRTSFSFISYWTLMLLQISISFQKFNYARNIYTEMSVYNNGKKLESTFSTISLMLSIDYVEK